MEESPQKTLKQIIDQNNLERAGSDPVALELVYLKREIADQETKFIEFQQSHPRSDPAAEQTYLNFETGIAAKHARRSELEAQLPKRDLGIIMGVREEGTEREPRAAYGSSGSFLDGLKKRAAKAKSIFRRAEKEAIRAVPLEQQEEKLEYVPADNKPFSYDSDDNSDPTAITAEHPIQKMETGQNRNVEKIDLNRLEKALEEEGYDLEDLNFRSYSELLRLFTILDQDKYSRKFKKEIVSLDLYGLVTKKEAEEQKALSQENIDILKTDLQVAGVLNVDITPRHICFQRTHTLDDLQKTQRVLSEWQLDFPGNEAVQGYAYEVAALIEEKQAEIAQMEKVEQERNKKLSEKDMFAIQREIILAGALGVILTPENISFNAKTPENLSAAIEVLQKWQLKIPINESVAIYIEQVEDLLRKETEESERQEGEWRKEQEENEKEREAYEKMLAETSEQSDETSA